MTGKIFVAAVLAVLVAGAALAWHEGDATYFAVALGIVVIFGLAGV